jgi:hypothetical protein
MVARFRIIAVIGIPSSSASQTAASVRCSGRTAPRGRLDSRTSSADSRAGRGRLGAGEPLDQTRQPVGVASADDPLEQVRLLGRYVQRRIAGGDRRRRVRQAQDVAVGDALATAVLDDLVRQPVGRLRGVPRSHRPAQRAAPAAPRPRERDELEQVRRRAAHLRQRVHRRAAGRQVRRGGAAGQGEDGLVVLGRPSRRRDRQDLGHGAHAVLGDALLEHRRVLAGQVLLARVERSAFRSEDQEAAQARPAVDLPDECALGVDRLVGVQPLALCRRTVGETGQVRHDDPPFGSRVKCAVVLCEPGIGASQAITGSRRPARAMSDRAVMGVRAGPRTVSCARVEGSNLV